MSAKGQQTHKLWLQRLNDQFGNLYLVNIVEREIDAESVRLLYFAKGSSGELTTQLYIAIEIGNIEENTGLELIHEASEISAMLGILIKIGNGCVRENTADYSINPEPRASNLSQQMTNQIQSNYQDAQFTSPRPANNEIDLRELFSGICQGKWIIIAITTVFAMCSVFYALSLSNIYRSEALLAPAESEQHNSGLAALAGQFGGLASMAGINIGAGSADKTELAIKVMKSRKFISDFIKRHNILPELMAADKWELATNVISYDPEIYDVKAKSWVRSAQPPYKPKPSLQEAYKKFMERFSVTYAKDTGTVTVSIDSISPYLAKQWVDWLVADINQDMKHRDVSEAIRGQTFLEDQLRKTNIADMRTVLYQLMEQAAKTIMFANVRDEYVFKTIDPALIPEEKSGPKRALICVLGTLLGGMLGVAIVLVRFATRK